MGMEALGEALDNGYTRAAYLRLGAGFGLLLAGAIAVGIGLLDVVPTIGTELGLAHAQAMSLAVVLGGTTSIAVLGVIGLRVTRTVGRTPLAAGAILSTLAVLVGAVGTPVTAGSTLPAVSPLVWATYTVGLLLMFAGGLAGTIEPGVSRTPNPAFSRTSSSQDIRQPAHADGGKDEDDDLDFLLDDDE